MRYDILLHEWWRSTTGVLLQLIRSWTNKRAESRNGFIPNVSFAFELFFYFIFFKSRQQLYWNALNLFEARTELMFIQSLEVKRKWFFFFFFFFNLIINLHRFSDELLYCTRWNVTQGFLFFFFFFFSRERDCDFKEKVILMNIESLSRSFTLLGPIHQHSPAPAWPHNRRLPHRWQPRRQRHGKWPNFQQSGPVRGNQGTETRAWHGLFT